MTETNNLLSISEISKERRCRHSLNSISSEKEKYAPLPIVSYKKSSHYTLNFRSEHNNLRYKMLCLSNLKYVNGIYGNKSLVLTLYSYSKLPTNTIGGRTIKQVYDEERKLYKEVMFIDSKFTRFSILKRANDTIQQSVDHFANIIGCLVPFYRTFNHAFWFGLEMVNNGSK